MTFRFRTALVVMILTAGFTGTVLVLVWGVFVASQRRQTDAALATVADREAAEAAAGALELIDTGGETPDAIGPLPKYGVIYSATGEVLSTTKNFRVVPPMPKRELSPSSFDFEHDGKPMRGVFVDLSGKAAGRRMLLASPQVDFEDDGRILRQAMFLAWLVGSCCAAVVAFGVASRLTEEHRVVEEVARRVAGGDTSARVVFRSADPEMLRLSSDLNTMIERLVDLVASQERFVSHAAHELRTPLASLRLELELALRSCRSSDDYGKALRGALNSSRRLSALAEDLLELARIDTVPGGERTLLGDAIEDAVADVMPFARARGVQIEVCGGECEVRGGQRELARVFRNLLENAVRFSPVGAGVRVVCDEQPKQVVVHVLDDGPGIAVGDKERIFEPFVRLAPHDDVGAGLGLSIARQLVLATGGRLYVGEVSTGGALVIELDRPIAPPAGGDEARPSPT